MSRHKVLLYGNEAPIVDIAASIFTYTGGLDVTPGSPPCDVKAGRLLRISAFRLMGCLEGTLARIKTSHHPPSAAANAAGTVQLSDAWGACWF